MSFHVDPSQCSISVWGTPPLNWLPTAQTSFGPAASTAAKNAERDWLAASSTCMLHVVPAPGIKDGPADGGEV